ncbi:MAG: hypothetical protein ACQEQF_12555 [Bacillota bacterium]
MREKEYKRLRNKKILKYAAIFIGIFFLFYIVKKIIDFFTPYVVFTYRLFITFFSGLISQGFLTIAFVLLAINIIRVISKGIYDNFDEYIWKRFLNGFKKIGDLLILIVDDLTYGIVYLFTGINTFKVSYGLLNIIIYSCIVFISKLGFSIVLLEIIKTLSLGNDKILDSIVKVVETGSVYKGIDIIAIRDIILALFSKISGIGDLNILIYVFGMFIASMMLYIIYFTIVYSLVESKFKEFSSNRFGLESLEMEYKEGKIGKLKKRFIVLIKNTYKDILSFFTNMGYFSIGGSKRFAINIFFISSFLIGGILELFDMNATDIMLNTLEWKEEVQRLGILYFGSIFSVFILKKTAKTVTSIIPKVKDMVEEFNKKSKEKVIKYEKEKKEKKKEIEEKFKKRVEKKKESKRDKEKARQKEQRKRKKEMEQKKKDIENIKNIVESSIDEFEDVISIFIEEVFDIKLLIGSGLANRSKIKKDKLRLKILPSKNGNTILEYVDLEEKDPDIKSIKINKVGADKEVNYLTLKIAQEDEYTFFYLDILDSDTEVMNFTKTKEDSL